MNNTLTTSTNPAYGVTNESKNCIILLYILKVKYYYIY